MDKRTIEQAKGQHGSCGTVRVKADNEQGFAVIDEHAFDPDKHEKYEEKKAEAKAKK